MTEKSIIATEKIAEFLKETMKEKGITAYDICKKVNKNQVYSVLRMGDVNGKNYKPNYSINTFLEVCGEIGVHIEFHDLRKKSNLDLDKSGQN